MMKRERAGRLLNESLSCRAVTGAGLEVVQVEAHGDALMPYLEFDRVLKVGLSCLFPIPERGEHGVSARRLERHFLGKTIECVVITSCEDGRKFAELSLSEEEGLFPMWDVEFLYGEYECELNNALIDADLQAPCQFGSNGGDNENEDGDDDSDDSGGDEGGDDSGDDGGGDSTRLLRKALEALASHEGRRRDVSGG